jgi:citrate lyase beta subunit
MLPVLRALLFMPGDDRRKIEKGAALGVDAVIMDIEDGVALSQKPAARDTIRAALREVDFSRTTRLVRVNPVNSVFHEDDLAATVEGKPDGYVIPKVESAAQVRAVVDWLSAHGVSTPLLAIVESARGVINLREIAERTSPPTSARCARRTARKASTPAAPSCCTPEQTACRQSTRRLCGWTTKPRWWRKPSAP